MDVTGLTHYGELLQSSRDWGCWWGGEGSTFGALGVNTNIPVIILIFTGLD